MKIFDLFVNVAVVLQKVLFILVDGFVFGFDALGLGVERQAEVLIDGRAGLGTNISKS